MKLRSLLHRRALPAFAVAASLLPCGAFGQHGAGIRDRGIVLDVRSTLDSLIANEDTDGDRKITVDDPRIPGTGRGDKRFWITAPDRRRYEVAGTYYLSNLLQELKLCEEASRDSAVISATRVFEPPVRRISRSIRELYWDGLTRHIDERGLPQIITDEKTSTTDGFHYLYVPDDDTTACAYYSSVASRHPGWNIRVVRLPPKVTPAYVRSLAGRHGLLTLALQRTPDHGLEGAPFVVPGGRFNEMYGWDSYFIVLGLLEDGRVALARSIVDNFVYEIDHYGAVLNANRTYYLTRSQPPFLTSMALAVFAQLPRDSSAIAWLRTAFCAAVREYRGVWTNSDRMTRTGLSRYYDAGSGAPPEVEPGAFDSVYARYARRIGMPADRFEREYRDGTLKDPALDEYFRNDRSMRESGHDTSYRLIGRSAHVVTVDLNCLLYKIERDIAATIDSVFGGTLTLPSGRRERSSDWYGRAAERKRLINRYLWDPGRGMFYDFDLRTGKQTGYVSATTFYPLWAGLASREQAHDLVAHAIPLLETAGGIAGSSEESRGPITPEHPPRQWDYPYGWAPHQMIAWRGFQRYGESGIARRLAYRWLYTITLNAVQYNGTVPEKFDVVRRTHLVFTEYGNVGTKFAYITREGFGWTNASFQVGVSLLSAQMRERLDRLIPPEWIFARN